MPEKSASVFGLAARPQTTYTAFATPVLPGDYVVLTAPVTFTLEYANNGERTVDPRSGGKRKRTRQTGRTVSAEVKTELRGALDGTTLSASVVPLDGHALRQACGLTATFAASGPTAGWTYAPGAGRTAVSLRGWARGQIYDATGCYSGTYTLEAKNGAIIEESFKLQGVAKLPVDGGPPAVPSTIIHDDPFLFDGSVNGRNVVVWTGRSRSADGTAVTPTTGNFTPVIRSLKLSLEGELTARGNGLVGGAHMGYVLGEITKATLEMQIEAPALDPAEPNYYDAYKAHAEAWEHAIDLLLGDNRAGKGAQLLTTTAQLESYTEEAEGSLPLLNLTFTLHTGVTGYDQFSLRVLGAPLA